MAGFQTFEKDYPVKCIFEKREGGRLIPIAFFCPIKDIQKQRKKAQQVSL